MPSRKEEVRAKVLHRNITFEEWVGGQNALKFATREQVVAFWNLALREQVIPIVAGMIERAQEAQREQAWYRRLWRWLLHRLRPGASHDLGLNREQAARVLEHYQRRMEAEASAQPTVDERLARPPSCVVCGSTQWEPCEDGRRCANGHVVEEEATP
jgi:hypothetical protein